MSDNVESAGIGTGDESASELNGALLALNNGRHPGQPNFILHFNHVSYTIKQNNGKSQQILNDTCGEFKSGCLTAILGPSGAGKTSMLNVMSGFKANGVTGNIELNDKVRNLVEFRKISSYIPQDFVMLQLLTVQETLQVSADLKLPTDTTSLEQKYKIIDNIIQTLNLNKCRHTLVRHLSGGERKRLSIGIELVTNPPIMFFDEPTSGLDSVSSLQVINYLRRLAKDGRIIVCVVHQPSSRLMKLFDDVMIMSKGQVLYAGPQRDLVSFFERVGLACPKYYNPADFVLEVGSEKHTDSIMTLIRNNKATHCAEEKSTTDSAYEDEKAEMLPSSPTHVSIELNCIEQKDGEVIRPKERVSFCKQFMVLVQRSFRSMSRNLICVQMRLLMHVVVGVLLGIVFWDIGDDAAKVLTNSSCIFFMVMFVYFGNAMPSILLCPDDTAVFIREYLNGWYSMSAYYIAKIVADLPMQFICPTVFVSIIYFMTGQPDDMERFAMCWGISLLIAFVGHFMGLVFGSAFSLQMAIFLVPGLAIPFMIFSGFFIRIHEVVEFLRPLCDLSFFRYALEGLTQAIYGYDREDLVCRAEFCYFKSPKKYFKELGMTGDRYGGDLVALLLWIVVLKVLFFCTLIIRVRKAQ